MVKVFIMIDPFFTFSIRAEQINQAHFSAVWSYSAASNLLIKELAGASAGGNVGISDSYYTDAGCNADNITLDSNVTSGTFNNTAFANHSLDLLRFTNPGPPIPSIFYDSNTSQYANKNFEFHGTCKPVTMGDYVNHTQQGSGFDNYFITAGFDGAQGHICINVNRIAETSTTAIVITNVGSIVSGLSGSTITTNGQIRLFAHPNWFIGASRGILLIGWDGTDIYIESYTWDGVTLTASTNNTLGSTNTMSYTGKHDIHYLNNGNILLLTMAGSNGTLFEIDGANLNVIATKTDTNIVAYDPSFDVIGIQKQQKFITFKSTLNSSPVTQTNNIFSGNDEPFDAVYHPDEQGTMYVGEYSSVGSGSLIGHRFNYDINGNITTNVSRSQTCSATAFKQIERTSPDVLMNSVGPNSSTVLPVRSVCDSGTYKATPATLNYVDSFNTFYEDITQMRHPTSQDYTISSDTNADSTITGNNHLICSTYGLKIGCYGQNYAEKAWEINNNTGGMNAHHMYILYLGFYKDFSNTDSYGYIVVSGINSVFTYGSISGAPVDGEVHWVKFRNN